MNGHIKRITDNDIQSSVLEIMSSNISTTFITCPADASKTLGIKLPFLVMIIKNVRSLLPLATLQMGVAERLSRRGAASARGEGRDAQNGRAASCRLTRWLPSPPRLSVTPPLLPSPPPHLASRSVFSEAHPPSSPAPSSRS